MSEFKKWWLKFEPQIDPDTYNGDEKEIRKAIARCAHRATLKWVQKKRRFYSPSNFDDEIKRELAEA